MIRVTNLFLNYSKLTDSSRISHSSTPVIGWSVVSDKNSNYQTAYRVVIYCASEILIDTGTVADRTQCFRCSSPLPTGKMLTVSISITDRYGDVSELYTDCFLCGCTDFDVDWITSGEPNCRRAIYFRRKLHFTKEIKHAVLYVCGIGYHSVRLDGVLVDNEVLGPLHSDYSRVCYYSAIPLNIKKGNHVLDITVADGWRHVDSRFIEANTPGRTPTLEGIAQLGAKLTVEYSDGTGEAIKTDEQWQYAYGNITEANLFDGEVYDARICIQDEDYRPVSLCPPPGGKMLCSPVQPIREQETYKPVTIFKPQEDTYVLDFGQNIAGYCVLPFTGNFRPGQKIVMRHGEFLNEDGTIFTATLRDAKCREIYIAKGGEKGFYKPTFTYHGFRYMQLEGYGEYPDKEQFKAVAVYTDIAGASRFTCGNPLVERIHKNNVQTEKANIHGILTDCPQRDERMGWLNDATVRFQATPYHFDIGRIFPKVVEDIALDQGEDGSITCTVPFVYGSRPGDPVCSSFLVAAYEAYLHTGNLDVIDRFYDNFAAWEQCLLDHSDNYIVNYSHYGDWAAPSYACISEECATSSVTPGILMSTGYSYYNCILLEKFAELTGRTEQTVYYRQMSGKIQKAFLKKWVNLETGCVAEGSQGAQAFALWLEILPIELRQKAADMMRNDLVHNDYRFTTGNLTTRYLFEMLAEYGYLEEAWTLFTRTDYPSVGFEINHEATTIWERFELKKAHGMNSHNHPMYGASDLFLHKYLAGIREVNIPEGRAAIEPYFPEELFSCADVLSTSYGDISVKWVRRYSKRILYVTLPFGMRGHVTFGNISKEIASGDYVFEMEE